jgi:hypothetical protein
MSTSNLTAAEEVFAIIQSASCLESDLEETLRSGNWLDRDFAIASLEELFQIKLRKPDSALNSIHQLGLVYGIHYQENGQLTMQGIHLLQFKMPYAKWGEINDMRINLGEEYLIFSLQQMAEHIAWEFRMAE